MIYLFSTSFPHGSNLSNLVRILFKLRDKLSHTASPRHGSGGISPVAAYRSEQPGAVCQGCTAPPLLRWLALDWRHRLFYFPAARRGYILQSRILSHDWERAGDWVEHQRRFTYELTNSPYERMMKEIPHKDIPAPQKAPEGTPCAGCPYWREIACVFCYQERLKKQS